MRKAMMLALAMIIAATCLAGWERTYGGSSYDYGESVAQTSDGGYIVAGYTKSFGADGWDVYLVKTDAEGNTIWTRTYGGIYDDYGFSVAQTSDGGYIVAGYTQFFGSDYGDVYLVKLDALGDTIWTHTYGGSGDDIGYSVAQTSDGGYIVAGETYSFGAGGYDFYLIKTDALGDTIWTRTYGGSDNDRGFSVAQTTDGGYIVAGTYDYDDYGTGTGNVYLVKTDTVGDTIWTRTYGGSDWDRGFSVAQTTDGGYVVAGGTYSFGAGRADFYLVKTDTEGDTIWTRTYGGSGYDEGWSVAQTTDGGYIVAGETYSFGADEYDVYLVKTDAAGDTIWTRTYGGSDSDYGSSVAQTSDGGYIVAGYTHSFGAGYADVYLIKTDSLGYTAIDEAPSARPEDISISAYPNPFNSAVNISLSGGVGASDARSGQVGIEIYDISGRLVADLPVTNCGSPQFVPTPQIWQPEKSVGSGIYLVRARFDKLSEREEQITKRIVYLK